MRKPSKKTVLTITGLALPLAAAAVLLSRLRGKGRKRSTVRV